MARMSKKNKQLMYYSKYSKSEPIYEKDDDGNIIYETFTDSDGTVYRYPKDTGKKTSAYLTPQKMMANIVMSGGDASFNEFGLDISDYSAVITCAKDEYDIAETSLIWFESEIKYKDEAKTEIEPSSADYRVVKVSPSLNYTKYVLQRVVN